MSFLLYGANGYTGQLTAECAVKQGLKPTLAGRNIDKIKPLAEKLGLDYLIFPLENVEEITDQIRQFPLVLHCAGPFSRTARPMVEACLLAGTHYLDITGEIAILDWVREKHTVALSKNIVLMCGVGFDLVPTDCVAAKLQQSLPDATHLEIAFTMEGGSISHGTMTTMGINLGNAGAVRIGGELIAEPLGKAGKWIDFGNNRKFCMSIPWGDLSSAWVTTGIPNIRTYTSVSKLTYYALKIQFLLNPVFRSKWFKNLFQWYVDKNIHGPSTAQNENGKSIVYGKVWNAAGNEKEIRLEGPESYQLTAQTSILLVKKLLEPHTFSGYHTPAGLFGPNLILEIAGTQFI